MILERDITLSEPGISVTYELEINESHDYLLELTYIKGNGNFGILLDDNYYGYLQINETNDPKTVTIGTIYLKEGNRKLKIKNNWGYAHLLQLHITKTNQTELNQPSFELVNPNATKEAKALMHYLKSVYGNAFITGQHTNVANGEEFDFIKNLTGKYPAIHGFDFLSYSFATETNQPSEHHIYEVNGNKGSVEKAIEWAKIYNGIVTFCWHWCSPIKGYDKSFYTKFTDFDVTLSLIDGTNENKALLRDLDYVAEQLKRLQNENIPVLWRPFHEADGMWFWWGAKGCDPYKQLWHLIYDRYTHFHHLNNLIWVWNAPIIDWYPGDEVVDIVGNDIYVDKGNCGPLKLTFDYTNQLTNGKKPVALTENGAIPDPDLLKESKANWLWFMTWNGMVQNGDYTSFDQLKKVYNHPYSITLDQLPKIY